MRTEKCVLYTRSSKDGHDISPAAQRTELRAYAERKGYRIVGDYSDAAVSANDNPPQLAEMLRELKNPKRPWGVILAVESSRIARDVDLAGVINFQVRKAGARIESSPLPRVVAGPDRLVGLFQNLVSNSIKYRDERRRPEIRVSAEREGPMWRFEVSDNGRGFEPADAERVFRIFERLNGDRSIPGTGLGLAICRRTVEAQGGRIWAESEPGRGTVFHFTLPAAPALGSVSYMEEGV